MSKEMTFAQKNAHQLYAHYHYTLSSEQQSAIQIYLRLLPKEYHTQAWELLHELTYADEWTESLVSDARQAAPRSSSSEPTVLKEINQLLGGE